MTNSPDLVERVARAIANAMNVDPDVFIGMHGRHKWEKQWHPIAEAAIAALEASPPQPFVDKAFLLAAKYATAEEARDLRAALNRESRCPHGNKDENRCEYCLGVPGA